MAARLLLQRRTAPLTAALLAGAVLYPAEAFAEGAQDRNLKKPIYDDFEDVAPPAAAVAHTQTPTPTASSPALSLLEPSNPTTTAPLARRPTPTDRLATHIRTARLFLHRNALTAEDALNNTMTRAFHLERSFTSTIAGLAPPRESGEKLMPGLVYVLVAAMAGSIVSRRRGFVLRGATPVAFGVAAGWTVIPITMRNVSGLLWEGEKKIPGVAEAHLQVRDGLRSAWSFVRVHADLGKRMAEEKTREAREKAEDWVRKGK